MSEPVIADKKPTLIELGVGIYYRCSSKQGIPSRHQPQTRIRNLKFLVK